MEISRQNLILINANIITLDPFCPQATWVAIENDKIVATGYGKNWKNLGDKNTGMIERNLKTGEPTGLLYEMGDFLSNRIPPLAPAELEKGIQMTKKEGK